LDELSQNSKNEKNSGLSNRRMQTFVMAFEIKGGLFCNTYKMLLGAGGSIVVETLYYEPEDRRFETQ
jgi:hypothetical protein